MKRGGEPQPIILPELGRKPSYSWASRPTVVDYTRSSVVRPAGGFCGGCGCVRSASDRYCGYCGRKLDG